MRKRSCPIPKRYPDALFFLLLLAVGGAGLAVAVVGAGWMLYALLHRSRQDGSH